MSESPAASSTSSSRSAASDSRRVTSRSSEAGSKVIREQRELVADRAEPRRYGFRGLGLGHRTHLRRSGAPYSYANRSGSGAVALLVLLARAAPAGIVAPDLLALVLDPGAGLCLLRGRGLSGGLSGLSPLTVPGRRDRAAGRRGRRGRGSGLPQRRGLLGAAPRVLHSARLLRGLELLLGPRRGDVDLHVEDQQRELLPHRVHELLEHRVALVLVGDEGVDLGEP